jgi:hypothetical protein
MSRGKGGRLVGALGTLEAARDVEQTIVNVSAIAENPPHPQAVADAWGPWSPTCHREERTAQLRTLAAIVHMRLGPHHPLVAALRAAEHDPMAFVRSQDLIDDLPSLTRRQLIATFSAITFQRNRGAVP